MVIDVTTFSTLSSIGVGSGGETARRWGALSGSLKKGRSFFV